MICSWTSVNQSDSGLSKKYLLIHHLPQVSDCSVLSNDTLAMSSRLTSNPGLPRQDLSRSHGDKHGCKIKSGQGRSGFKG